jgi:two-component system, cell cycle sensor histidine kinase and response regulator CckA
MSLPPPKAWPTLAIARGTETVLPEAEADDALYMFDQVRRVEMTVRLVATGIPAVALWVFYGEALPTLAFVLYCLSLLDLRRSVRKLRQGWSDLIYRKVMLNQAVAGGLYSGITLWLLSQPQPVFKLSAAAILLGILIYGLTATVRGPQLQRIDNLITTLTIIGFGVVLVDTATDRVETVMIGLITVSLAAYFHIAAQEKLRDRDRMQGVTKAGLNAKGQAAVGRLAGGFAHDFNNLLTTILGNLELYDRARTKAEERAAVIAARQAAERGAQLVAQLLSVSGRALMQPGHLDLPAFLADLRQVTNRLFGPEINFQIETHPDLPPVIVDRSQLTAALIQLLINARDAMPEGGMILLEASRARRPHTDPALRLRPGAYVQIDIYDEGIGIDPADLPRVTEPFFTTRKFGESTGLGLSVAKGFAEQSGGSLSIRSQPGKGTRVTLHLPAGEPKAPPAPAPQS